MNTTTIAAEAKNSNLPANERSNQVTESTLDERIKAAVKEYYPEAQLTYVHRIFAADHGDVFRSYMKEGYFYPDKGKLYSKELTISACTNCVARIILCMSDLPRISECYNKIKEQIADKVRRGYRVILRNNGSWYIDYRIDNEEHDNREKVEGIREEYNAKVTEEQKMFFEKIFNDGSWTIFQEQVIDLAEELYRYAKFDLGEDASIDDVAERALYLIRGEDPNESFEDFLAVCESEYDEDLVSVYNNLDDEVKQHIHQIVMDGYAELTRWQIEEQAYEEKEDLEKKHIKII